jgi:hypothetical protein
MLKDEIEKKSIRKSGPKKKSKFTRVNLLNSQSNYEIRINS